MPDCPNQEQHTPQPEGYLAASEWAGEMQKTHRQIRCKGCQRWAIWVPKNPTGTCFVCGNGYELRKDGRVRYHGPHPRPCAGSGRLPAEPNGTGSSDE